MTRRYVNRQGSLAVEPRIFREGVEGFKGGLSAENYISITGAARATATRDLHDLVDKRVLIRYRRAQKHALSPEDRNKKINLQRPTN